MLAPDIDEGPLHRTISICSLAEETGTHIRNAGVLAPIVDVHHAELEVHWAQTRAFEALPPLVELAHGCHFWAG